MSLTQLLKLPHVKNEFKRVVNIPKTASLSAPKVSPKTKHYSLVGMAFDYLLRFYIERLNTSVPVYGAGKWVAWNGMKLILKYSPEHSQLAVKLFDNAVTEYKKYLRTGVVTEGLIKSAIHLAQLEVVYRAKLIPDDLGEVSQGDIEDLMGLINIVNPENFRAKKHVLLNPDFGMASLLVGGADADLIIDDTLIDFKTTKVGRVKPGQVYQLVGYYVLSKIDGIYCPFPNPVDVSVNKVGIYFSRHGELVTFKLSDLISQENIDYLVKYFKEKKFLRKA